MPHFKDQESKLHFLDSTEFANLLPAGCVQISDEEAAQIIESQKPQPTPEQLIAACVAAVQAELDRQAQTKGYDNIVSACSYAAQPEGAPFQAEGAAFLAWRSAVWVTAYAMLDQVQAGEIPMPTPGEAVAMMPPLVLPS